MIPLYGHHLTVAGSPLNWQLLLFWLWCTGLKWFICKIAKKILIYWCAVSDLQTEHLSMLTWWSSVWALWSAESTLCLLVEVSVQYIWIVVSWHSWYSSSAFAVVCKRGQSWFDNSSLTGGPSLARKQTCCEFQDAIYVTLF